jgi:LPXTG-site transpeptidase (sortase) family protein
MTLLCSKRIWLGLAAIAVIGAVAWSAWVMLGPDGDAEDATAIQAAASTVAIPSPTPQPRPPLAPAEPALPQRIVIPKIGVDAPVSVKSLDADGTMQPPNGPEDVAWYDFTARPGSGGNAVFSAHVDYHDYGPAVFAGLKDLKEGDAIEVRAADGAAYRYRVAVSVTYPAAEAPVEHIVGPTSREAVTLITCTGSFDASSRQYSHRLVVRAERVQPLTSAEGR